MVQKLKANRYWSLYHEIRIGTCAMLENVPRPTIEALNLFEKEAGIKLPTNYRDFVLLLGAGELSGCFNIFAPVGEEYGDKADIGLNRKQWQESILSHNPDELSRMLPFCREWSGPLYGWSPNEVSASEPDDYRIYRLDTLGDIEVVADSFHEFVTIYCFTHSPYTDPDYIPDNEDSIQDPHYFEPVSWRTRQVKPEWEGIPEQWCQRWRDVVSCFSTSTIIDPHWLRRDNFRILRLAYNIHEVDNFEDMPILADALEEAGCSNQDLLSHLRIDGWHLRNCWALKLIFDQE